MAGRSAWAIRVAATLDHDRLQRAQVDRDLHRSLVVSSAPAAEPVTTAEVKAWLRIPSADTAHDTLVDRLVKAARTLVEKQRDLSMITQTLVVRLDEFPSSRWIELPRPPLQSVTSITYTDTSGASSTFAAAKYKVDTSSWPGRIALDDDDDWPTDELDPGGSVVITYVAGYGASSTNVPEDLRTAVQMLAAHWFELPAAVAVNVNVMPIPFGVDALLSDYPMRH